MSTTAPSAPLALTAPDVDRPDSREALLDAYTRAGLYREGITFEHAMASPAIRICLANTAHAAWKARHPQRRTQKKGHRP